MSCEWDDYLESVRPKRLIADGDAVRPPDGLDPLVGIVGASGQEISGCASGAAAALGFVGIPIGSESVPGKKGVWRYYVEPDGDAPF